MINYYLVTKPGIVLGNLVTLAAGFLLASKGQINFLLFIKTVLGLTLIMASACVFNNYIDRDLDKKMKRTKERTLVKELISSRHALFFATSLGILGAIFLFLFTNLLTLSVALFGFFVYVVLYSFWKCKTIYGTAIGSLAGAVPPVVGYCAVSNHFDKGALILFFMLVFWQMAHFFSIALTYLEDYAAAEIPVLPVIKGAFRTKVHMLLYILCFILTACLLTFFNYTGYVYLIVATTISLIWLFLCMKGFRAKNDQLWGRDMFRLSLVLIGAICFVIPLEAILKP